MPGGGGNVIAFPMTRLAGLLIFSSAQASDIADGSTNHGFLSKYMLLRSESSAHDHNRMERGGRTEALSDHYVLAEDASAPVGSSSRDGKLEGGGVMTMPTVDS